ncbi:MAG: FtsK/SpoIIIE domain-containing protein [Anaerolineae bacterium]|nr:FtsK/SpoIIIE domain-containing protein [Anaerolineae bacterium]
MRNDNRLQSANFNRPPRIQLPTLPDGEVDLPAPPQPSDAPEPNALVTILPVMGIGVIALFYVGRAFGDSSGVGALFAVPMVALAGFSIAGAFLAQHWRRKQHEQREIENERQYIRSLHKKQARLQAAHEAQKAILEENHPDTTTLLQRGLARDSRLWERRPDHHDFMQVRLGRGRIPSSVHIKPPNLETDNPLLKEATVLVDQYRYLKAVPIVAPLKRDASISYCGRRSMVLNAIHASVCQLAMTHAPQDLHIHLVAPLAHHSDWQWLKWLPHTSSTHQGQQPDFIAYDTDSVRNLVGMLSQVVDSRRENKDVIHLPHLLVIIDDMELMASEVVYQTLLREGQDLGVSTIFVANRIEDAPGATQAIVDIGSRGQFRYIRLAVSDEEIVGDTIDLLSDADADHFARSISGIVMPDIGSAGRIPQQVDFLEMYGIKEVGELVDILNETWQRDIENTPLPFAVPIGRESLTMNTYLMLDEDHHGPHGVLAGTTGSGKSELLQTLVAALAIEHDPRLLNLLLIDFKGGSTFRGFRDLPHTGGMVTNLDGVLVQRALEALKAETEYRQEFLKEKNMRDIHQYHQFFSRNFHNNKKYMPLPHLIIIVDEFAQLAREMPDFMKELVRTVQVGRSLGLHLILGTQSPMDIITDEMNANLQFRICLRVQSVEASRAMLRRPDAAYLPTGQPGRGFLQVGEHSLFKQFQTAYAGDDYNLRLHGEDGMDEAMRLELITERGERVNLLPDIRAAYPTMPQSSEPYTIARAMSDLLHDYAGNEGLMRMPPLLLPPLEERITLALPFSIAEIRGFDGQEWDVPANTPVEVGSAPLGLVDDIYNRSQDPLWIHLNTSQRENLAAKDGHLLVMGGPGSGKTTLLQTLALSEAVLHPPQNLHMYFVSFTGTGLDAVSQLPHAEKVIYGTEIERVRRLFGSLLKELDWRANHPHLDENRPVKIVFIDQYEQFRDSYWETHMHDFERLIQEGRAVGIYVVMTASSIDSVPDRFRSLIPQRIALQLNNASDYDILVGRTNTPMQVSFPVGRGYVHHTPPLITQVCLPCVIPGHPSYEAAQKSLGEFIDHMRETYHKTYKQDQAPAQIRNLPTYIPLHTLYPADSENGLKTTLGYSDDTSITPFVLDWQNEGPHFIVTGVPGSGKTNLLLTAALTAAEQFSPQQLRILVVDFNDRHLNALRDLKHVVAFCTHPTEFLQQVKHLALDLQQLQHGKKLLPNAPIPTTVVMIDDYDMVSEALSAEPEALRILRDCTRVFSDLPFHIWAAGYLERTTDPLMRHLMLRRTGFALGSRESLQRLYWHVSGIPDDILPEGRAYVPQRNQVSVVQIAHVAELADEIERMNLFYRNDGRATWQSNISSTQSSQDSAQSEPIWDETVDGNLDIDVAGLLQDLLGGDDDD